MGIEGVGFLPGWSVVVFWGRGRGLGFRVQDLGGGVGGGGGGAVFVTISHALSYNFQA